MRRFHFFLSQLADSAHIPSTYDDLVDAPEPSANETTSPAVIKQKLLHIMTTECYLNQTLHRSHTVIRSDLEWFRPSLPHDSILTVLEFIGLSKQWVGFYKAFLRAPLRFAGDPEVRIRKRGMGGNHFYDKNQAVAWKPMCIMPRSLMRSPYLIQCDFNRYFI